jgi:hypothetical protein
LILLWLPDNKPNIQENTKKESEEREGAGGGERLETEGTEGFTSINQKKVSLFDSPLFCHSVEGYERPQKK